MKAWYARLRPNRTEMLHHVIFLGPGRHDLKRRNGREAGAACNKTFAEVANRVLRRATKPMLRPKEEGRRA